MPNVKAKEIHELYSLKSRRVHFPEATWQFLIHAATNVARLETGGELIEMLPLFGRVSIY